MLEALYNNIPTPSRISSLIWASKEMIKVGGLPDIAVALEGGRGPVQLDDQLGPVRQRLGDRLRTLQEEEPGLGPGRPLRQFGHGTNAR